MEQDLIKDVAELAVTKKLFLDKLINIADYCISDYILEAKLSDEDMISIDIGIGVLQILITSREVQYNFIPSTKLEKSIIETYQTENSVLSETISESLVSRMLTTYKELF